MHQGQHSTLGMQHQGGIYDVYLCTTGTLPGAQCPVLPVTPLRCSCRPGMRTRWRSCLQRSPEGRHAGHAHSPMLHGKMGSHPSHRAAPGLQHFKRTRVPFYMILIKQGRIRGLEPPPVVHTHHQLTCQRQMLPVVALHAICAAVCHHLRPCPYGPGSLPGALAGPAVADARCPPEPFPGGHGARVAGGKGMENFRTERVYQYLPV